MVYLLPQLGLRLPVLQEQEAAQLAQELLGIAMGRIHRGKKIGIRALSCKFRRNNPQTPETREPEKAC
ncbi:MAG: hypothetical protein OHK0039_02560 [Bacteroidia bacterium]